MQERMKEAPIRVLVEEPDSERRQWLQEYFRKKGIEAVIVASPEEATKQMKQGGHRFTDIVTTDIYTTRDFVIYTPTGRVWEPWWEFIYFYPHFGSATW